ncbi:MAG TPA: hypothetical protein VIV11_29120 [Kofleriaceae bacterium]
MQERPGLRAIELSGAAAWCRRITLGALPVFAAIGALGYVLPAHQLSYDEPFHSNYADGGPWSLVVLAAVAVSTFLLRKRGFGAGIAAGVTAMGGAVWAVAPVLLAHMFQNPTDGPGELVFALGILGLFFVGAIAFIAEPILYVLERRRIVRATLPAELPVARVFS